MDCEGHITIHQGEKRENPYEEWGFCHGVDGAPMPRVADYESKEYWQYDYDEWYRNKRGHCPNFCGHF